MIVSATLRISDNSRDQILADATRELSNRQHEVRPFRHVVTPSQRTEMYAESRAMPSGTVHRNKATLRKEVEERLTKALSEAIPAYVAPAKRVADEIGTSTGTVDNLRQRVPEAMVTLVMIARAYPKFGSQVARLMALDAELDPGFQREFSEFIRRAREA